VSKITPLAYSISEAICDCGYPAKWKMISNVLVDDQVLNCTLLLCDDCKDCEEQLQSTWQGAKGDFKHNAWLLYDFNWHGNELR
jgi:hypothetical protein